MNIYQVQDECRKVIRNLVNKGELVCNEFQAKPKSTYFCDRCGYSQYIHLCKQIKDSNINQA